MTNARVHGILFCIHFRLHLHISRFTFHILTGVSNLLFVLVVIFHSYHAQAKSLVINLNSLVYLHRWYFWFAWEIKRKKISNVILKIKWLVLLRCLRLMLISGRLMIHTYIFNSVFFSFQRTTLINLNIFCFTYFCTKLHKNYIKKRQIRWQNFRENKKLENSS